jgi:predicted PurR-regulated permease PerM
VLIIPVIAYYLLVELDRIRLAVLELIPRPYRSLAAEQAERVDRLVSGFIRGQLSRRLILGVLYGADFAAIGIDLAIVIGADLFGFLGLLIAVAPAAVVQVFAADLVAVYRTSPFYTGAESAQAGGSGNS